MLRHQQKSIYFYYKKIHLYLYTNEIEYVSISYIVDSKSTLRTLIGKKYVCMSLHAEWESENQNITNWSKLHP